MPSIYPFDRLLRRIALGASLAIVAFAGTVHAQPYPSKPIRLIVPAPAGSPPDYTSRWLADRLSPALNQPIIVENRAGAGGIIGTTAAAKSPADGYTIAYVHQGYVAFNPFLYAKPGYDALNDFAPIARILSGPLVLAVNVDTPTHSVGDLLRLAKAKPGTLTSGTVFVGTPPYMAAELFRRAAGIDVTLVPFQAGNFAVAELVAGRVTYTIDGIGVTVPHVKAGKLRMLAVSGEKRMPQIPDVPTFAEAGLSEFVYETWAGLWAPAGTPSAVVERLASEIGKVMAMREGRDTVQQLGWIPYTNDTPTAFVAHIKAEHAKWGRFIREAGLKID